MNLEREIAGLFLGQFKLVSATETFQLAEWRFEGTEPNVPEANTLLAAVRGIPERDRLRLNVRMDGDPVAFHAEKPDSLATFLAECNDQLQVAAQPASAAVTITLSKSVESNAVSLYSLSAFVQTLRSRRVREQLAIFDATSLPASCTWVQLFEETPSFSTATLMFGTTPPQSWPAFRRTELRARRDDLCHSEYSPLSFVPDDFHLLVHSQDPDFNLLLDELCACASLLFLADFSAPASRGGTADAIEFKVNGYKAITGTFEFGKGHAAKAEEWYRIYEWVYSGGSASDKLGLSRNIMSLHWKGSTADLVEGGVYSSIRSGYEIYLKQNVKQYIDIKNKLNDYLADLGARAAKMGDGLSDKFEKNITAFLSFFITSILAKVLTDKSFVGVFNRPVATIGLLIVAGSTLHLWLTTHVFNRDRRRLSADWDALKQRYSDLLNSDDLQRILDKAGGFQDVDVHLKAKRDLFVGVWILLLVVAASLVLYFADWKANVADAAGKNTNSIPAQSSMPSGDKSLVVPMQMPSNSISLSSNRVSSGLLNSPGPRLVQPTNP